MDHIPVSKARSEMKEIINRVAYGKEHICLTSHQKEMVAIIPIEDLEKLKTSSEQADLPNED